MLRITISYFFLTAPHVQILWRFFHKTLQLNYFFLGQTFKLFMKGKCDN